MARSFQILQGDVLDRLRELPVDSVHCCCTSPPYFGMRDYGVAGQIGLEATPEAFVAKMVEVFAEVRRALHPTGTLWLNIGDGYSARGNAGGGLFADQPGKYLKANGWRGPPPGYKAKDLLMTPWRIFLALQADGWYLRSLICWAKKSPMPESVLDRPTSSWEPIALMAKQARYYYDAVAVRQPYSEASKGRYGYAFQGTAPTNRQPGGDAGRREREKGARPQNPSGANLRNVWRLGPEPFAEAHFATFPQEIPRRAIAAGTSERGCCPACLAPYARVVERKRGGPTSTKARRSVPGGPHSLGKVEGSDTRGLPSVTVATMGWEPTCACDAGEPIPCTVLDPFSGAATTGLVAVKMGRRYVGIELNPEYCRMGERRILEACPLFA